jgi:hypothetical protein
MNHVKPWKVESNEPFLMPKPFKIDPPKFKSFGTEPRIRSVNSLEKMGHGDVPVEQKWIYDHSYSWVIPVTSQLILGLECGVSPVSHIFVAQLRPSRDSSRG